MVAQDVPQCSASSKSMARINFQMAKIILFKIHILGTQRQMLFTLRALLELDFQFVEIKKNASGPISIQLTITYKLSLQ
jgi:hypothetical protein